MLVRWYPLPPPPLQTHTQTGHVFLTRFSILFLPLYERMRIRKASTGRLYIITHFCRLIFALDLEKIVVWFSFSTYIRTV
jgi:hypothetical protein